jgi:hypothetical protein
LNEPDPPPAPGGEKTASGELKTEMKKMKLKIRFGSETRFDQPIRRPIRTGMQWAPGFLVATCTLAMAGRPKPIKAELTGGVFPQEFSP